ncbi:MAG: endonuclease/exonuclease/phosphatase family protein [Chitinophagales bacterium]
MPPYYPLLEDAQLIAAEQQRIAQNLLTLKRSLKAQIPVKTLDSRLLLASWNIREFDSTKYGQRTPEAIAYIAEIIRHFDLIAIQEVRRDLTGLNRLMKALGKNWNVIFSDTSEGQQGNQERFAFVYDNRKITMGGMAGRMIIPPKKDKDKVYQPQNQLYRPPYLVSFEAGWTRFIMTTVHIAYGGNKNDAPNRLEEIRLLTSFLSKRADAAKSWSNNMILLGDFNIFKPDNDTFKILNSKFFVPPQLQKLPSNAIKNKHYDQIAFRVPGIDPFLPQPPDEVLDRAFTNPNQLVQAGKLYKAGVFDFFEYVFKEEEARIYEKAMGKAYYVTSKGVPRTERGQKTYYKTGWRTFQMSDHLPMWIELPIDDSEDYLIAKTTMV